MSEPDDRGPGGTRPAFSAPLYAALRQGAKEAGQALVALPESIRPVEEPGTLGNPTQQMVTEQSAPQQARSYDSLLESYAARGGVGREQQQKETER